MPDSEEDEDDIYFDATAMKQKEDDERKMNIQMDVMGIEKEAKPHPRVALATKAEKKNRCPFINTWNVI